jgi:tetratricopeptide (TPR) repeat protein
MGKIQPAMTSQPAHGILYVSFIVIVLVVFFLAFLRPIGDGDLYWHLASGRWVWENTSLPSADPFAYTIGGDTSQSQLDRVETILRSYWIGQLALYGTWQLGGDFAIVVLRTLIHFGILLFLFTWMRAQASSLVALFLTFLVGVLLIEYPNERPQLFSFLIAPVVLFLLEKSARLSARYLRYASLLPPVMLLWSHIHGAFLLGNLMLAIYFSAHILRNLVQQHRPDIPLLAIYLTAMGITLLNPTGIVILRAFFTGDEEYFAGITEYLTPLQAATDLKLYLPTYWAFLAICLLILINRIRSIRLEHLGILIALAALSLTALRHVYYFLAAAPLLVTYLPKLNWTLPRLSIFGAIWLAFVGTANWEHLANPKVDMHFPTKAVSFIQQTLPERNLFNEYGWGGYLALKLPQYPVFVDGRGLYPDIVALHNKVMYARQWVDILDHYRVNIVLTPGAATVSGISFPLIPAMKSSSHWKLVYSDENALIFVRNIPQHATLIQQHEQPDSKIDEHIVKLTSTILQAYPQRAQAWVSKGDAELALGKVADARVSFQNAINIDPDLQHPRRMLQHLSR